jgi:signal peptidase II
MQDLNPDTSVQPDTLAPNVAETPKQNQMAVQIIGMALLILALDQITKIWARAALVSETSVTLIHDWLKFTYLENTGIAFGMQPGGRVLITVFSVLATLGICYYVFRSPRNNWPYKIAIGLVLGGAVGNLIDRVFYGKVTDFIHVDIYSGVVPVIGKYVSLWPVFNVADSAIVASVCMMLIWYKDIFESPPPIPAPTAAIDAEPFVQNDDETFGAS